MEDVEAMVLALLARRVEEKVDRGNVVLALAVAEGCLTNRAERIEPQASCVREGDAAHGSAEVVTRCSTRGGTNTS